MADWQHWVLFAVWVVAAYLAGSIPWGVLIARARGVDIRKVGSGNVGATNVGRVLGGKWGGLCFVLDLLKGTIPVLAAGLALGFVEAGDPAERWGMRVARGPELSQTQQWLWLAVAVVAVLGHVFPVWLGFRGGKGVATGLGVALGIWPVLTLPGFLAGFTWLLLVGMFRYISLASILAALALPVYMVLITAFVRRPLEERLPLLVASGSIALLILVRHRGNVVRLVRGTEPMVGRK